ncbi:MAG: hypothetical protein KDD77_12405, partial [Caldilineaceae bacterium]|nr:hypothetical protein [Caldilineaceae bacterium]
MRRPRPVAAGAHLPAITMSSSIFVILAERLVDWHTRHQRDLPWRHAPAGQRDPYRVWISEIMLQQT